jgi:hypothetical protein
VHRTNWKCENCERIFPNKKEYNSHYARLDCCGDTTRTVSSKIPNEENAKKGNENPEFTFEVAAVDIKVENDVHYEDTFDSGESMLFLLRTKFYLGLKLQKFRSIYDALGVAVTLQK